MLIQITNGTYGYRPMILKKDHKEPSEYVVPITRNDPPIDVDGKEAKRLVEAGVAEYVHIHDVATAPAPSEDESPIGNMSNSEDGLDSPGDGGNEDDDLTDDEDITVFSIGMKADELRAAMRERNLPIRVGMTKAEMVEALNGSIEEAAPDITPQDVVEE